MKIECYERRLKRKNSDFSEKEKYENEFLWGGVSGNDKGVYTSVRSAELYHWFWSWLPVLVRRICVLRQLHDLDFCLLARLRLLEKSIITKPILCYVSVVN